MTRRFMMIVMIMLCVSFYIMPQQKARAIDPVTLAILTPVAIKGAQILAPYVVRGLRNMAVVGLRAVKYLLNVFLIPVGLVECTILGLWMFRPGVGHLLKGFWGICCFVGNVLILPISFIGIGL